MSKGYCLFTYIVPQAVLIILYFRVFDILACLFCFKFSFQDFYFTFNSWSIDWNVFTNSYFFLNNCICYAYCCFYLIIDYSICLYVLLILSSIVRINELLAWIEFCFYWFYLLCLYKLLVNNSTCLSLIVTCYWRAFNEFLSYNISPCNLTFCVIILGFCTPNCYDSTFNCNTASRLYVLNSRLSNT